MTISPSRVLNRVVLFAGALAFSVGVANAQGPAGVWTLEMDFNGNVREATMTITGGGGAAAAGNWVDQQGESELGGVKIEGASLSFVRTVSFNDQSFDLPFNGTVEGNTLTGSFVTDFGEFPVTGTRGVVADPSGVWNIKMEFNGNIREATVTIAEAGGKWVDQRGESELGDVKIEGASLSFLRTVSFNDQTFEMPFRGAIEGDSLTGAFVTDFGELPITGTRAPAVAEAENPAMALVGTWDVASASAMGGGETNSRLTINEDLTGVIESDQGSAPVQNIALEGDQLTYVLAIEFQGESFELAFAGTLEGSKFTGSYSVASFGEVAQVIAEKVEAEAEAEAPAAAVMVGSWTITSEAGAGQQSTLVINEDLTGAMSVEELGVNFPLDFIELTGEDLAWGIAAAIEGQEFYLEFAGKLDGEKFTGTIWVGDQEMGQITGTKKDG